VTANAKAASTLRDSSASVCGRGRPHGAARPREDLDPELALELADRLRERRLRDVEALGGTAEMKLLVDRTFSSLP